MRKFLFMILMLSTYACTPKDQMNEKQVIQAGDELRSQEELSLSLPPASELALGKNSSLKVVQHVILEKEKEVINTELKLSQGSLRVKTFPDKEMDIDQKIVTDDVSIRSSVGDFETVIKDDSVEVKVYQGQIQVSSPYVQSFVPEIVNEGETLIFSKHEKKFLPRK